MSIEKNDNDEQIINDFIKEVKVYIEKIKCNSVLLYPYSHLSSNLESPKEAQIILNKIENKLKKNLEKTKINRAPFGWTKELNLKIKGHPLAENSKTFIKKNESESLLNKDNMESLNKSQKLATTSLPNSNNDIESNALVAEDSLKSSWFILDPQGNLTPYSDYTFEKENENLNNLFNYELAKKRTVDELPPHVKLMKKLGIADYEPASDSGNMRFYPKGRLIKSLIGKICYSKKVSQYGGLEVETPIMYDSHHPSMESYFNRFPARQYNIKSDQ